MPRFLALVPLSAIAFLAVPVRAQQRCLAGQTEIRPGNCQKPKLKVPSIVDYRPVSTLVVPEHKVPRPRYPVIDFHGHPWDLLGSSDSLLKLGAAMDSLNLRVMVAANDISGDDLTKVMAALTSTPSMKDRVRIFTGINFK